MRSRNMQIEAGLVLVLLVGCATVDPGPVEDVPSEAAAPAERALRATVSGISSGAQMATQLHVARSDLFEGAALLAGGPWGCAGGDVATALTTCIKGVPAEPDVDALLERLRAAAGTGEIADPALLGDDPVWLYRGTLDAAVAAAPMEAARDLYARLVDPSGLATVFDVEAGHTFPTEGAGTSCDEPTTPWIGACGFDAAGALFAHLEGALEVSSEGDPAGELRTVEVPGGSEAGMLGTARLWVPESCAPDESACDVHVALHGCLQSEEKVGLAFVEDAGYLGHASAHGVRVLFPQVAASAVNPLGCWDWWGYTGQDYLTRTAPQIQAISAVVEDLLAR